MYRSIILAIAFLVAVSSASAGSLSMGVCYPTIEQARAEFCNSRYFVWGQNGNLLSSECTSTTFTGTTWTRCVRTNSGACVNTTPPYPAMSTCSHTGETTLAADFFVALLGFLVVVFCSAQVKNHFWHRDNTV